ncbi:MAG TPA: FtsW/RodA/SpoVE family cell cycle protein [Chthoniobacterales bacterium]|nr:FtsW/RodA/SpoVE family cell cycle protein [Chthoniobacterales bacterium]
MHPLLRKLLGFNWLLLGLMLALMFYGVYAIYSATWMRTDIFWHDQVKWAFIGIPVFIVVSLIDYRWVRIGALPLYLAGLAGVGATLVLSHRINGAQGWLNLGFMNFQPSQLALLAGILTLSLFLSQFKNMHSFFRLAACGVIAGAPWLLILLQNDLGSALVWIPVVLGILFIGGIPKRYLISLILLGAAVIPLVINFGLKPYQKNRILTFIDPSLDPQGAGWDLNQCLIAIGSGGMFGKGFKAPNTLNELGFLNATAAHNDYIFAVLGEQHGFIGAAILIGTIGLTLMTALYIVLSAHDELGQYIGIGIVMMLFAHVFENIGMTIQVMPITGIPLPLISYGGTFLLITLTGFGLLQSIWIHRRIAG